MGKTGEKEAKMRWIRPGVVIILVASMVGAFFLSKVAPDIFVPFATGLIVYWFKARDTEKGT